jgi:hypothetical protein
MNGTNLDFEQEMPAKRQKIMKPDLAGLVDPLTDESIPLLNQTTSVSETSESFRLLQVVWTKMIGYKPSWTPGIISAIGQNNQYLILFIQGPNFAEEGSSENTTPTPNRPPLDSSALPKWYIEEHGLVDGARWLPPDVQYAHITGSDLRPWEGPHADNLIKAISKLTDSRKRRMYLDAILSGNRMHARPESIPTFVIKDSEYRQCVQQHSASVSADLAVVRPLLKMAHLKLFLECNMMELHWRTIAYARQYVRAVGDEIFGGYHLIAAQDWPRDEEVEKGVPDVILMYPGAVLTADEAAALEVEERNGVHVDRNRYVAEMPNTAEILDKSGTVNLNTTKTNLFVDGLKYSDPTSPLWAPGPTVNHERTQYCKLEPHHVSGKEPIRGFWLQRKRGEIITKGEPLFWSYDCGAGKFDADYGLHKLPPPIGWISSDEIRKLRKY